MNEASGERLIRWIHAISRAHTLGNLTRVVVRALRDTVGAQGASFVVRDQHECVYLDVDAVEPLWRGERFPLTACVCGWAMLNRMPAIVPDVLNDDRTPAKYYRGRFVKSLLVVPVRAHEPLGALGVYWAEPHEATEDEVASVQTLADAAAVGMENIRLLMSLEASRTDAERRASENAALSARLTRSLEDEAVARDLLRDGEARFRNMADNLPAILWATDADGSLVYVNRRWAEFTGLGMEAGLGDGWRITVHAEDLDPLWESFGHARERGDAWLFEYRQRNAQGQFRWMLAAGRPWHGPDGELLGYVGSIVDITDRRAMEDALRSSEERMRFMMRELDHRVKNTLASVLSVCDHTFAASRSPEDFRDAFHGRLHAMARTHEALAAAKWAGARLREIVMLTLGSVAPRHARGASRLEVGGPEVLLPAAGAMPVAATLHELATNALKYGAWSNADGEGRVRVGWELDGDGAVRIEWSETGGPRVAAPVAGGFGLSLVRGMIEYELRGRVDHRFEPDGVCCNMRFACAPASVGAGHAGAKQVRP